MKARLVSEVWGKMSIATYPDIQRDSLKGKFGVTALQWWDAMKTSQLEFLSWLSVGLYIELNYSDIWMFSLKKKKKGKNYIQVHLINVYTKKWILLWKVHVLPVLIP